MTIKLDDLPIKHGYFPWQSVSLLDAKMETKQSMSSLRIHLKVS
jgi:hypothetical protein